MGKNSQMSTHLKEYQDLVAKWNNRVIDIEMIAKEYHEMCREMVNKQIGMITAPTTPYIEWKDLSENQRDGRRFIAKKILEKWTLIPR
jgi:hypothetical protein